MPSTNKIRVFVSSTCYDLLDLRSEIRRFLEDNGFSVALSEDPNSPFIVDPTDNSIATCLTNVESSDVVVCLLDRRYGGRLDVEPYKGLSATHAEIRKARAIGKPVFFFIRDRAWLEYQQLQGDPSYDSKWVETRDPDNRRSWFQFVQEVSALPQTHSMSNWCDMFSSSVDLRSLVLKRLCDHFPEHIGIKALLPERLVRLSFVFTRCDVSAQRTATVFGHFRNVGVGPALNIYHGYKIEGRDDFVRTRGALGEKENITDPPHNQDFAYRMASDKAPVMFCEYSNRFGDRYRVELALAWSGDASGYEISGEERFFAVPAP
jgi:Domain of unknown function (DUF4062)